MAGWKGVYTSAAVESLLEPNSEIAISKSKIMEQTGETMSASLS